MSRCQFYREEQKFLPSNEIRNDRQVTGSTAIKKYCTHMYAGRLQISKEYAETFGGGKISCEGDEEKCHLKELSQP